MLSVFPISDPPRKILYGEAMTKAAPSKKEDLHDFIFEFCSYLDLLSPPIGLMYNASDHFPKKIIKKIAVTQLAKLELIV